MGPCGVGPAVRGAGSFPAGAVTLGLISTDLANNTLAAAAVGALFFTLMVVSVLVGVRITARIQVMMSAVELAILLLFAIPAFAHGGTAHPFSWSWVSPASFHGLNGFFAGPLVAGFYDRGWDITAKLSQETKQAKVTPGFGGIFGVMVVFALFMAFTIGSNMVLTDTEVNHNRAGVLDLLGQTVWPRAGGKLIALGVTLSTVATLGTTLIRVTRALFAMGRDGTLRRALGRIHPT